MHPKQKIHQRRMWWSQDIVLESEKIRQYVSDL